MNKNPQVLDPAELIGPASGELLYSTISEAWLDVSQDRDIGITFHNLRGDASYFSYQDLLAWSKQAVWRLKELGVSPGDRVALVLPTSPEFVILFFAIILVRAVPAPLYPPMTAQGMNAWKSRTLDMFNRLNPSVLITNDRLMNVFQEMIVDRKGFLGVHDVLEFERDRNKNPADITFEIPSQEEIAFVQFSSGTTVAPKPVALTHKNLMSNATAIGRHFVIKNKITLHNLNWCPLYHDLGLIGNVLMPVIWKARNELLPPQDFVARPWLWLQLLSRTGAVSTSAPNFAFYLCLQRIKDKHMEGLDLSHVELFLNCAEPIHPDVIVDFENRFAQWGLRKNTVIPAYGLSEVSLAATLGRPGAGLKARRFSKAGLEEAVARPPAEDEISLNIASGGEMLEGGRIRIASVEDSEIRLDENQVGEILIESDSVTGGYLEPDGTINKRSTHYLQTGDLGFIFAGDLYISGRKKDLIITNGRNIYPQYLEETMGATEGVREGLCVAVSHTVGDTEEIYGFVECTEKILSSPERIQDTETELRNQILKIHGVKLTKMIILNKHSLPRTTSGKVRRSYTLELYLKGKIQPALERPR